MEDEKHLKCSEQSKSKHLQFYDNLTTTSAQEDLVTQFKAPVSEVGNE